MRDCVRSSVRTCLRDWVRACVSERMRTCRRVCESVSACAWVRDCLCADACS